MDHYDGQPGPLSKITAIPADVRAFVGEVLDGLHEDHAVASLADGQVTHYRVPANWFSSLKPHIVAHVLVGRTRAAMFYVCDADRDPGPEVPEAIRRVANAQAQDLM